jgi:hypothetical protein
MADPFVYVSRQPEVVGAWLAGEEALRAYVKQTRAVLNERGLGEYKVWRSTSGWRPWEFRGLDVPQDEFAPEGWRLNKSREFAVPDKRTKAGKQIAAALAAVKHPGNPGDDLPGMPADVLVGGGFQTPAIRLLEDRTALYVAWRTDPAGCRESFRSRSVAIDRDLWERAKLSDYYAAVEAYEASAEAQHEVAL